MNHLELHGVPVAFVDQGSGEPVVLLHSSTGSSGQWRALIERLGERYRVIAPDLYGYGATPLWPGEAAFTLEREAEIVLALLGRLGQPAHLVGHSYGGAVALHVARERPDLLATLCVIEPVAFHLLKDSTGLDAEGLAEIESVAQGVTDSLAQGAYCAGIGRFLEYWSGPGAWERVPAAKRAPIVARLGKVALDFHAALNDGARLRHLADVALPTLVIQGGATRLPTRRICEQLAAAIPEARKEIVAGAGHMLPLTHSREVNELVVAHLEANAISTMKVSWKQANTASYSVT